MSDTYQINDRDEVVPYIAGRKCTDTRAWREATELELEQRDEIARLEKQVEGLIDALERYRGQVNTEGEHTAADDLDSLG
jgi:hypothetical protein